MFYRTVITGAQPTDGEHIRLDCYIQKSADNENWSSLEGSPDHLLISLGALRGVLRTTGGPPEKRAALQELIRGHVRALPALYGAIAVEAIEALLPAGWPVTIPIT
jgi:hypothetical protein